MYEQAAAAITLATEQGFALWMTRGTVLRGWARAMRGQSEQGIAEMRQGLAAELATGAKVTRPYYLGLLTEAYEKVGNPFVRLSMTMLSGDPPRLFSYPRPCHALHTMAPPAVAIRRRPA